MILILISLKNQYHKNDIDRNQYGMLRDADFLSRNPGENLLMTSLGMVDVDLNEPDRHLAWIKNENREALPNVALLVQLPNLPIVQKPQQEPQAARASHLLQDAWKLESGSNGMGDGTRKSSGTDAQNGKPGSLYKGSKLFQAAKGVFSVCS